MLSDTQFLRYQRQLSLTQIGEHGQHTLLTSKVLVIGCGGLGSAAVLYLAAAGIGQFVIIDDDTLESSNLHRQVIYRENQIGKSKVKAMAEQITAINKDCRVRPITKRIFDEQLQLEILLADVVLDCTDNIKSRHLINQACRKANKPLISGAAIGWQGQIITFDHLPASPCYQCLVPNEELPAAQRCDELGVIGPVVGVIGALQALQTIKLLTKQPDCQVNQMTVFDGQTFQFQTFNIAKDSHCDACCLPIADSLGEEQKCPI